MDSQTCFLPVEGEGLWLSWESTCFAHEKSQCSIPGTCGLALLCKIRL